jgi:hypothetical protein
MKHIGINPERLMLKFMYGADGNLLAEYSDDFARRIKELGPLGKSEGMDAKTVKFNLEAARQLVPYMRLVERERFRVPVKSKQTYDQFFENHETDQLFDDIFSDKLAISQIMLLLKEKPLPTKDIADKLALNPSDVARHMISSSRHGMVRYDTASNCYALA